MKFKNPDNYVCLANSTNIIRDVPFYEVSEYIFDERFDQDDIYRAVGLYDEDGNLIYEQDVIEVTWHDNRKTAVLVQFLPESGDYSLTIPNSLFRHDRHYWRVDYNYLIFKNIKLLGNNILSPKSFENLKDYNLKYKKS